ncbi:MAG: N(G),N(G)-dimethylarginine dimethylaminohydrolase [Proteobacteria bacterium]|nr:N(G),N(G)-dimethylarginine dimethylaminohydrolase [Pseudomonadota bacterium]
MFSKAIVRTPAKSMVDGITTAGLGKPDYELALEQHRNYIQALESCGLAVTVLEADERYPDAQFVEDVALLLPRCAIMTRPGAESRRGEVVKVSALLDDYYDKVDTIQAPGTADAGDIMMVGDHCYIGLSERTNHEGASQIISALETHGYTGSTLSISEALHLKSSVSYLENNRLVVTGELCVAAEFADFDQISIPESEGYATNCVWINDRVLVAQGYPQSIEKIRATGLEIIELDVSEFCKLDGGLSCLSLRF